MAHPIESLVLSKTVSSLSFICVLTTGTRPILLFKLTILRKGEGEATGVDTFPE